MSVRTVPPPQSKLELIGEIKLLYCLLLRAVYELGDTALLWHVNHGELRCMEAIQATFQNSSNLAFYC